MAIEGGTDHALSNDAITGFVLAWSIEPFLVLYGLATKYEYQQ